MDMQRQHMRLRREAVKRCPQRQVARQIEMRRRLEGSGQRGFGQPPLRHFDHRIAGCGDRLHRAVLGQREPGAQGLVPVHHILQRGLKCGCVERAFDPQREAHDIGVAVLA